jgi:hypothetical protein
MISLELFFNDTLLCYHRKIKQMILGRYCSYLRFATGSSNTDIVVLLMLMFGMVDLWKSADIHK